MIIKKFTAPTMTEALSKVREELGSDAVILNTRTEKQGGVFDFLGRRLVEVTAAVDESPSPGTGDSRGTAQVSPDEARAYPPERPAAYGPPRGRVVSAGPANDRVKVAGIEPRLNFDRLSHDIEDLKRSVAYATCVASFNVEDFGVARLAGLEARELQERFAQYRRMLEIA